VLLVQALGGGWDSSQLPEVSALSASDKPANHYKQTAKGQ